MRLNLKGVLIDFGDTLVQVDKEGYTRYEEALLSILRKHRYESSFEDVDSTLTSLYEKSTRGELKSLREFWALFLKKLGMPASEKLMDDLEEVRSLLLVAAFRLYDGVLQALSILQKKYKPVLVSNCAIGMREVISVLGLAGFFEHIILSYEVGIRKPDRRIYVEALRAVGLEAYECIFVTDEISDLEGAKAVGMRTLLVCQGSNTLCEAKDPDFKADFQCNHVSEIAQFL